MNSKNNFNSAYKRLNPGQKKAVDAVEGPVMVIAGPGTGKTQVLTMRIANILDKTDAEPEAILALTFTESGVASMRKRLAELIGSPAYKVSITTFHGFANFVIKNYPDYFPEIIGSTNINEIEQIEILKNIIDKNVFGSIKPFGDKYYYLHPILAAINELKRQGIGPENFAGIIKEEKVNFERIPDLYYETGAHKGKMKGKYIDDAKHVSRNKELAKVYAEYQKSLRAGKHYDYSDMIMYVMMALEKNGDLLRILQETYLYILVDEHQDTNKAQNKILELLANYFENPNLFVVGDEKQAIYRFQGASLENFLYFKNLYKEAALIFLNDNYRSTQAILNAAHDILPSKTALIAKSGHKESPISVAALSAAEMEYYFIAEKIKELIKTGVSAEEIAVLYRDNKDAAPLARVLEKRDIPFNIESDQDVLSDEDIKKLLAILKTVQHYGSAPGLFDVLHVDFLKIPALDIYKIASSASKNRINPYEIIKSEPKLAEAGVESKETVINLYAGLSKWKKDSKNKGAAEAFENICRESGFLAHILDLPAAVEKIAKLHALFEHLKALVENKKNYSLDDFFSYLDLVEEHNVSIKTSKISRLPGKVRLMTAHKSKGLEFEYVFIMNAIDGKWGSRRRFEHIKLPQSVYSLMQSVEGKLEKQDDERNLFYVAVTRAKKEIFVTYSGKNRDGKDQLPSQFLGEINADFFSKISVEKYEKDFSSHKEIEFAPAPDKKFELRDREFLKSVFAEQGLSPTSLNNYLECPWRYFYCNLIRVPEAPNKHLMYGNAVHEALKNHFEKIAKGEDSGKDGIIRRFKEALIRQPMTEDDFNEALEKGKKSLAGYYDFYRNSWPKITLNEFKIEGVQLDPETKIKGKIDKIEIMEGSRVNVVDYKTGKPKSRNAVEGNVKDGDGNYKRQLVFYNLLLDKAGKFKMSSGEIDFIEPDEKGRYHKERFEISPYEISGLEEQIKKASKEITNLEFWDRFCEDPKCRYCMLRKMTY